MGIWENGARGAGAESLQPAKIQSRPVATRVKAVLKRPSVPGGDNLGRQDIYMTFIRAAPPLHLARPGGGKHVGRRGRVRVDEDPDDAWHLFPLSTRCSIRRPQNSQAGRGFREAADRGAGCGVVCKPRVAAAAGRSSTRGILPETLGLVYRRLFQTRAVYCSCVGEKLFTCSKVYLFIATPFHSSQWA